MRHEHERGADRRGPPIDCRAVADVFEELRSRASDRYESTGEADPDLSDVHDRYVAQVAELSRRWGTPRYTGPRTDMPETRHDFGWLRGDFGRAWLVTWWEADDDVLVMMVTYHDAGSLVFWEYEAIRTTAPP
jgi:hypothetical protein